MAHVPVDHEAARAALGRAGPRFGGLMRSLPDAALPIPRSEWTVGQAAVHVAETFAVNVELASDGPTGLRVPEAALANQRLAAFYAERMRRLPSDDPEALAGRVEAGVRRWLEVAAALPGEQVVATPHYGPGAAMPVASTSAILLGELLVHGWDIARAAGRPWPIDPGDARLVLDGVTCLLDRFVDPRGARGVRAGYQVRLRGGAPFTVRVADGALSVDPSGAGPVDCRISADPVAFLLVGYGRIGQWGPILRGKLLAGGRKPWLGLKFQRLLLPP